MMKSWWQGRRLLGVLVMLVLWLAAGQTSVQAQAAVQTELVNIPCSDGSSGWLQAKLYRPELPGKLPAIVLTHGTPREAALRVKVQADSYYKSAAEYFAKQGYAVVFVVRRGFGNSQEAYAENVLDADGRRNYFRAGLEAARDLTAAVEFIKTQEYVDAARIVLIGQSTGGHSVIATGSRQLPGVAAVVNFAGGRGSYAPDKVRDEDRLILSMGKYGETSRIPTLWLYSENDHYFRPALAQAMFEAYTASGGMGELVKLPANGSDGHSSFVNNRAVWAPYVKSFLEKTGLGGQS